MRINVKGGTVIAAVSALAITVPAAAHPGGSSHPNKSNHPGGNHSSQSRHCKPHNVAYVESGTVNSATASTLAANGDGSWTGTLVVDVTSTNRAAKADKGTTVTYSFTNAKLRVRFRSATTGFTAGERVKLIGKLAEVSKKCATSTPTAMPVFRMAVVHPAAT
jgi:hypothetical protein